MDVVGRFGKRQWLEPAFDWTGQKELDHPLIFRRVLRLSRYSPGSMRSTSNSCPGLMLSCCRISAGSTTCPLLDTVVVICGKIPSYSAPVKQRGKLSAIQTVGGEKRWLAAALCGEGRRAQGGIPYEKHGGAQKRGLRPSPDGKALLFRGPQGQARPKAPGAFASSWYSGGAPASKPA